MQVEAELAQFKSDRDMLLTIGMFDGVHLGHQYLLSRLVAEAKQKLIPSAAVTFKQHPRDLFQPRSKLSFLTTLPERERLIKQAGVDSVVALSFTRELADLSAEHFLALLKKYLCMKGLVIGPDTTVGKDRTGGIADIRKIGEKMDFSVTVVAPQQINGETISSTVIRNAIGQGEMRKVTALLGRPFSLQGNVATGAHRGTGLGFPTANINVSERQALPPDGVYATRAYLEARAYPSMTNIGKRPTFGAHNQRTVEVFILDYHQDIYGKDLKIELIERLRGEKKFEDTEALKKQIAEDIKRGRDILAATGK